MSQDNTARCGSSAWPILFRLSVLANVVLGLMLAGSNSYRHMDSRAKAKDIDRLLRWLQRIETEKRPAAELERYGKGVIFIHKSFHDVWGIRWETDEKGRVSSIQCDGRPLATCVEWNRR